MQELNIVEKILKIVPIKNLIFISIVSSSILLFAPEWLLMKIYLKDFKDCNGFVIGIVFLISLVFWINYLFSDYVMPKINDISLKRKYTNLLSNMKNTSEINIIANFLNVDNNTLYLSCYDGSVRVLRNSGIISPVSSENPVDISDPKIAYYMKPVVYDIIDENETLKEKFSDIFEELDNESIFV